MSLVRWLMNWISGIIGVAFLLSIIVGILLVNDLADFREQFYEKGSVLYMDIDHRIESGFTVDDLKGEADFSPVPLSELYDVTDEYIDKNWEALLKGTSRAFVFKEDAFKNSVHARIENITIDKDVVLTLLKSHELGDDFRPATGHKVSEVFGVGLNDDDIRWRLFARLVFTQVEDEGPLFLLQGMQKDNILVSPKSFTFYLLPWIPDSTLSWLASPERMQKIQEVDYGIT
ncbi:MAG: hypothetical protein ACE5FT_00490 [Candidatus Nanoarchaeia archaeon]